MSLSRSLDDAHPWLAERVRRLMSSFSDNGDGASLVITCVHRSQLEQDALWAQGRTTTPQVNALREKVGLPPITEKQNKSQVTWVRTSKHMLSPSRAVDLAVAVDGDGPGPGKPVITWTDLDLYEEMGTLAERLGLVWGGRWRKPDYCHVEMPKEAPGDD